MFDEVIKIIEEEGIDVESLFIAAFEKLSDNNDQNSCESESETETEEMTEKNKNIKDNMFNLFSDTGESHLSSVNLVELKEAAGLSPRLNEGLRKELKINLKDVGKVRS